MSRIELRSMARARDELLVGVVRDLASGMRADRVEGHHGASRKIDRDARILRCGVREDEETLRLQVGERADSGAGWGGNRGWAGRRAGRRRALDTRGSR